MTLSHQTVMFDVHDAAVAPLLTDPKNRVPTYGPLVDVPGISEVGLDPNFVTAELKGDARVIAKKGRIDRMNFSGTYAKLDLDVQAVIFGTSVADLAAVASSTVRPCDSAKGAMADTTSVASAIRSTVWLKAKLSPSSSASSSNWSRMCAIASMS